MIPPTLTLDEAARHDWDAVVVGAGPAGALAARELARSGTRVLLVDKATFPRWKVCGCCLNGQALAVLRAVGLGALASGLGAIPLERIRLGSRGRHADLPLAGGVALSREALDAGLIQAAIQAGVAFLPQTQATLGPLSQRTTQRKLPKSSESSEVCSGNLLEAAARTVALRQGEGSEHVTTRLVVAADGLGGRLLSNQTDADVVTESGSWIGAGAVTRTAPDALEVRDKPEWDGLPWASGRPRKAVPQSRGHQLFSPGTIFMACGRGGYVGLVRLEDGRLNVAAAFDPDLLKRHHPGQAATTILQEAGFPELPGLAELAWRGTPALTRQATRLAYPRLFVIGDAAGYVQPFTGEGIAWALAAGQAVAALAARGLRQWHPGLEAEWDALYWRTIVSRQQTCRTFMRVLSHPLLTAATVAVLSHWPALAGPVLRRVHHAAPHLQGVSS